MAVALVTVPVGPPVIAVSGAVRSIFTVTERWLVRPAPLVAEQVTVVARVSDVKVFVSQSLDEATSETGSDTAHWTDTSLVYQPFAPSLPVTEGVMSGALESYLKVAVAEVDRPAPFVHEPLSAADFVSGPLYGVAAVHDEMADTASVPEKATVSGCVYQPRCDGFDVGSAVTAGPVVSTLTTTLAWAVRPSVFEALQVTVVPGVSEMVVASQPAEVAMPDSGSLTTHATLTALVNQPSAPAVPESWGTIEGGVVSASARRVAGFAAAASTNAADTARPKAASRRPGVKA